MKERRYNWHKVKKDFEERLEAAVPKDLKGNVGLIDSNSECDFCRQKRVLFLDRKTKKMFCSNCRPGYGAEYTAIEFNAMWQLAREILFYADEAMKETKMTSAEIKELCKKLKSG